MKKKSILFLVVISSLHQSVFSLPLFESRGEGAASTGLGRCAVLVRGAAFSGMNNPAATGEAGRLSVSGFSARPYSVPDLVVGSLWASKKYRSVGLGAGFSLYGNDLYREERMTMSTAFGFRNVSLGTSLSINRVLIDNLGQRSFVSLSLGFVYDAMPLLAVGGSMRDFFRVGNPIKDEVRPTGAVSASIRFPDTSTLLLVELRGSSRYPLSVSLGLETVLWNVVNLRMGTGKNPSIYSVGLGIHYAFFAVDLGVEEHTVLGQTRSISITVFPSSIRI